MTFYRMRPVIIPVDSNHFYNGVVKIVSKEN